MNSTLVGRPKLDSGSPSLYGRAAWLVWAGAVNLANGVVLWMVLARWREAAEVGRFTISISLYFLFVALCSLGLGPVVIGEYARRSEAAGGRGTDPCRERSTSGSQPSPAGFVASAAVFLFACSILFAVLMAATGLAVSESGEARLTTAVMSLALLPSSLIVVAEAVFTASGRTRVVALATTTENVFRTLVPLALVVAGCSLPVIGLSFIAARVCGCLVYAIAARRKLAALRLVNRPDLRRIAAATPTFAGINVLSSLHWQLAALLLGRWGGELAAAQYGVASRFLMPTAVLLASYSNVVLPEASRLACVSHPAVGEFLSRGLRLVVALALPFAVGAALLAREAVVWLFGARYASAAPSLALLAAGVIPLGVVMIVSRGLIAAGRQRVDLLGNAAAVVTCAIGCALLIPKRGATGAAAAHLISLLALAAVEVVYVTRRLFRLDVGQSLPACVAPLVAMASVVWLIRAWGLWSAVLIGGTVYLSGLWLVRRNLAGTVRRA